MPTFCNAFSESYLSTEQTEIHGMGGGGGTPYTYKINTELRDGRLFIFEDEAA
jgi:hypothetical protein